MTKPPESYSISQELNWNAPWIDVSLRLELPFWVMTENVTVPVDIGGHEFSVAILGDTFELHGGWISDSKQGVVYQGPLKKNEDLSEDILQALKDNPDLNVNWRKCKTVLKISTRCNEDAWEKVRHTQEHERPAVGRAPSLYLEELCRTHIPVVNKLIQGYRLVTYDYFAFEVSPWDIPHWHVERGNQSVRCTLVPYRRWDHRPIRISAAGALAGFHHLIKGDHLRRQFTMVATPGEFELLDALNLIERGDYSGAVRRVTTAIEEKPSTASTLTWCR